MAKKKGGKKDKPEDIGAVRSGTKAGKKAARAAARSMSAAQPDRLTTGWTATPMPVDMLIRRHQRILVARSREQCAENDYGKAFLRMVRQNVVGPMGIRLQAQSKDRGTLDTAANDAIEAAFAEWSRRENCDVAGRLSFRSLQAVCATGEARDGEFMVRKHFGQDAGPWGFALQVLDPQRCPVDLDIDRIREGYSVRHGIEINRFGRPIAYYFSTTDERDADMLYSGRAFIRIPADEIIHGFLTEIAGQKRGLPWMATALWRMRMLHGYEEAALTNARVSAAKGGFFRWQDGYGPEKDEDDELTVDIEPGMWQELPPGVEPVANHPPYPVGELPPFRKEMLRGISAGLGVAYNNFANDLEGVNFSSIRQGALDEREHWKGLQEDLIEQLIDEVYREWLPRALLSGRIVLESGGTLKPERIEKYRNVMWLGRRWQWIDPRADVEAAVSEKNNLLGSFGAYIRDQGRDPQTVWREIATDIAAMREAGIPEDYIKQAMGQKLQPAGAGDPSATAGNGARGPA